MLGFVEMEYQEISNETLTRGQEKEVSHGLCLNCKEPYQENRKIMVARIKYTTLWWHYPNTAHCGHLNDKRRSI